MGYNFRNLDAHTRTLMIEEISGDVACHALKLPHRLTPAGQSEYPGLLRSAAATGSEETFAAQLRSKAALVNSEMRRGKTGATKTAVPVNAAEIMADEEFNRFYVRAICRLAIENGSGKVEVYRAKTTPDAANEVELGIGKQHDAARLLADLRNSVDLDAALGLSSGRHAGLTLAPA